ncbi:polysaccharide deacetylase family protein [Lutibacter sp. B2]|nr:polysaccharide deacetylase family protein [Lutibacter sp. B2]
MTVYFVVSNKSVTTFYDKENSKEIIWNGSRDEKLVALTFDDGPHPRFTPKILDVLKEYDAKATFFMLGKHVKLYPKVVKRVAKEGHEIGNHTYTHIDVKANSSQKIQDEFKKTQEIVYEVTGKKPTLFRPPYGFYNSIVKNITSKEGCRIVLWSTHQDSKDWSCPGVNKIVNTVVKKTKNGDIVILHDYVVGESDTIEALKTILPELKKKGFKFVTVSELLEISFEVDK